MGFQYVLISQVLSNAASQFNISDSPTAFIVTLVIATVPIYIGFVLPRISRMGQDKRRTILIGAGVGILFASFFDLTKETAGISTSKLNGVTDLFNVVAFSVGLLAFLLARTQVGEARRVSLPLLYLWALLGIGFHGLGEGVVIGYDFSTGATILSIFQTSSFILHKLAEGFTMGLLFAEGNHTWRRGGMSGLVAGFPTTVGTLAGMSGLPPDLATYFFAVGAGATVYMAINLATLAGAPRHRMIAGVIAGFLYMYLAGVLHQFR